MKNYFQLVPLANLFCSSCDGSNTTETVKILLRFPISFKTFIVSGGGIDFMRARAKITYGISPYQFVGSSGEYKYKYESKGGLSDLVKIPELNYYNEKEAKGFTK